MKKKCALFASALWMLSSLWAVNLDAAEDEKGISKYTVALEINVPGPNFYIIPLDGRQDVRQIRYDPIRKKFLPLRIPYRFFNNSAGFSIGVKLKEEAKLTNEKIKGEIQLAVKISNALDDIRTNKATIIRGTKEMKQPKVEDIIISVIEPSSLPPAGTYQGTVSLIFESTIDP